MPKNGRTLERMQLSAEEIEVLRRKALQKPETASFSDDPEFFSLMAALGIHRELGTQNDELTRFIFDALTGEPVSRSLVRSELIRYKGTIGIRIWVEGLSKIELRFPGLRALIHPDFSSNEDGSFHQLVIFPSIVAKIAELEGIDLAFVRPWALNTIFELHPFQNYYLTNIWELKKLDALRFASLVEAGQVPFLGTHDLVAHIAGSKAEAWPQLKAKATETKETIRDYLGETESPWLGSLVLPYIAGILLDDLTQPPAYGAPTRSIPLDATLSAIRSGRISSGLNAKLILYPENHEKLIALARFGNEEEVRANTPRLINGLVQQVLASAVTY